MHTPCASQIDTFVGPHISLPTEGVVEFLLEAALVGERNDEDLPALLLRYVFLAGLAVQHFHGHDVLCHKSLAPVWVPAQPP